MKIGLDELRGCQVQQLVIESVDPSLYIAQATVDGKTCLVVNNAGKPLKARNLLSMKRLFSGVQVEKCLLRQRSAYDEMIGHDGQTVDNTLEIPMNTAAQPLPEWEH